MDSFLTLETPSPSTPSPRPVTVPTLTPNFTFSHQSSNFNSPPNLTPFISPQTTTISTGASLQTLLVPKPEHFDDFFTTQDSQQQPNFSPGSEHDDQADLYTEFYGVSQLFKATFGQSFYPFSGIDNSNNVDADAVENMVNDYNNPAKKSKLEKEMSRTRKDLAKVLPEEEMLEVVLLEAQGTSDDARFAALEAKQDARFAALEDKQDAQGAEISEIKESLKVQSVQMQAILDILQKKPA